MSQSIFEASKKVKSFIMKQIDRTTTVQTTGVVAIKDDDILVFRSVSQATLIASDGYVFSYIYRNGDIEITPEN